MQRSFHSSSGQAVTEYILLLAVVVVITAAITRGILSAMDTGVLSFGGSLEKALKSGRARNGIWRN